MQAIWKNQVIAISDKTTIIEGNHYFPPDSINWKYFEPSNTKTFCPWKGEAHYLTVTIDGLQNNDAAWYYPEPKKAALNIKGYIAFWHGIEIVES